MDFVHMGDWLTKDSKEISLKKTMSLFPTVTQLISLLAKVKNVIPFGA